LSSKNGRNEGRSDGDDAVVAEPYPAEDEAEELALWYPS
jgi:hypothetical protein